MHKIRPGQKDKPLMVMTFHLSQYIAVEQNIILGLIKFTVTSSYVLYSKFLSLLCIWDIRVLVHALD
jgi:hypothetical protein